MHMYMVWREGRSERQIQTVRERELELENLIFQGL